MMNNGRDELKIEVVWVKAEMTVGIHAVNLDHVIRRKRKVEYFCVFPYVVFSCADFGIVTTSC